MYNGIGLLTARGSGTSGHVQSNSFNIRSHARNQHENGAEEKKPARVRKADDRILEHERKREIELKLLELTESLEDSGYATAEIEQKVKEMRQKMLLEHAAMSDAQKLDSLKSRDDTHALAKRKEAELARFKQAFGVQGDESVEEAGEVKALEAPPERLMIEPAKPAVPERFAAAEKALEEQLLREEQEELEREREKRAKRQAEKQRRREEKAAAEAAERARVEEERAREEQHRRELEERRRAEEDAQRRQDRHTERAAYEGRSRGDHYHHRRSAGPSGPPRGSSRCHSDADSGYKQDNYAQHMHERSRRDNRASEDRYADRYVEEVGPLGRDQEYRDREHGHGYGGYKRRREDMHEHHDTCARDYDRERSDRYEEDRDRGVRGAENGMHERHARRRYDDSERMYERERGNARHSEREGDQQRDRGERADQGGRHHRREVEAAAAEPRREYSRDDRNSDYYRDEKRPREREPSRVYRKEYEGQDRGRGGARSPGYNGGRGNGTHRRSHSPVDSGGRGGADRGRVHGRSARSPGDSRGRDHPHRVQHDKGRDQRDPPRRDSGAVGRGSHARHSNARQSPRKAVRASPSRPQSRSPSRSRSRSRSAPRRERSRSSDVDDQDGGVRGRGRRSRSAARRSRSQSPSNSGDSLSFGSSSDGSQ